MESMSPASVSARETIRGNPFVPPFVPHLEADSSLTGYRRA
jgi:hypothetical protein